MSSKPTVQTRTGMHFLYGCPLSPVRVAALVVGLLTVTAHCALLFEPPGPIEMYADGFTPPPEPGGACITNTTTVIDDEEIELQTCEFVLSDDCDGDTYRDGLTCRQTLIAGCILATAGCRDTVVAGCTEPDEVHPGLTCAQVDPYGACVPNDAPDDPDQCDVIRASQCAILSNYSHMPDVDCDEI